jgi:hypothetical protein
MHHRKQRQSRARRAARQHGRDRSERGNGTMKLDAQQIDAIRAFCHRHTPVWWVLIPRQYLEDWMRS